MKQLIYSLIILVISFDLSAQAREEVEGDGYIEYYVIEMLRDGKLVNTFKQGRRIVAKIGEQTYSVSWYFKAEPDVVTLIGFKGKEIGDVVLNNQKKIKLETTVPERSNNGLSFGLGVGPVGISTGLGGGGPRFYSYDMSIYTARLVKQRETKEEKYKREYAAKRQAELEQKELAKAAKKARRKNK